MNQLDKFNEIAATYRKHGWRLARVLMAAPTFAAHEAEARELYGDAVPVREAPMDALWFTRATTGGQAGGREAWELRLVSSTPYALFEIFEADEAEEDREDVRREMEARLAERGS